MSITLTPHRGNEMEGVSGSLVQPKTTIEEKTKQSESEQSPKNKTDAGIAEVAASAFGNLTDSKVKSDNFKELRPFIEEFGENSDTACFIRLLEKTQPNAPRLEWNDRFAKQGGSYIDNLDANDMSTPVMWGIDKRNKRPCIFVRALGQLTVEGFNGLNPSTQKKYLQRIPSVTTLFQRYSGNGDLWAQGRKDNYFRLKDDLASLQKLLEGKEIELGDGTKVKLA